LELKEIVFENKFAIEYVLLIAIVFVWNKKGFEGKICKKKEVD